MLAERRSEALNYGAGSGQPPFQDWGRKHEVGYVAI